MKQKIILLAFFLSLLYIHPVVAIQNDSYKESDKRIQYAMTDLLNEAKLEENQLSYATMTNNENPNIQFKIPIYYIDSTELTKSNAFDDVKSKTFIVDTKEAIPLSNESHYVDELDSTSSILANITIYYTTNGTPTQYLLTRVSGGYQIRDYSVSVSSQKVTFGCNGVFPTAINTQTATKYPGSNANWSYNTGFKQPVVNDISAAIGCNNILTLKHGSSSTWTLHIFNNL